MASEFDMGDRKVQSSPLSLSTNPVIPVSIVSNSRLLCDGLITLLQPYIKLEMISTFPALPIPTTKVSSPSGHIALLDSNIGINHIQNWARFWRGLNGVTRVLALEIEDNAEIVLAGIEAGIHGYVLRGATMEEVALAIEAVQRGDAQCSPQMTSQLFARLAAMRAMSVSESVFSTVPLTSRELQVLDLVAKGYSNKEIGVALCITLQTVKYHIHHILNKLKLKHRRDAVTLALKNGWVKHPPTTHELTQD